MLSPQGHWMPCDSHVTTSPSCCPEPGLWRQQHHPKCRKSAQPLKFSFAKFAANQGQSAVADLHIFLYMPEVF